MWFHAQVSQKILNGIYPAYIRPLCTSVLSLKLTTFRMLLQIGLHLIIYYTLSDKKYISFPEVSQDRTHAPNDLECQENI